jgi:hypothetical protein
LHGPAKTIGNGGEAVPDVRLSFGYPIRARRSGLADADINRSPRPNSRRDVDPSPGGTAIPIGQEYPVTMEEAAEAEVSAVFEEVAAHDPMVVVTIEIAVPIDSVVTIKIVVPIGTIV